MVPRLQFLTEPSTPQVRGQPTDLAEIEERSKKTAQFVNGLIAAAEPAVIVLNPISRRAIYSQVKLATNTYLEDGKLPALEDSYHRTLARVLSYASSSGN